METYRNVAVFENHRFPEDGIQSLEGSESVMQAAVNILF